MPRVVVVIKQDGTLKVDARGFVGSECKDATKFLDQLSEISNEDKKPEFYQQKVETQTQNN